MKVCATCGKSVDDNALFCPQCGAALQSPPPATNAPLSGIKVVAEIFMILGCVSGAVTLIPLCWCIPMTVSYCRKVRAHQPIGTGFKVCSLLFVNLIAGILMLCDNEV